MTNTLAYYKHLQITTVKSLTKSGSDVNGKKYSSLNLRTNKMERFYTKLKSSTETKHSSLFVNDNLFLNVALNHS